MWFAGDPEERRITLALSVARTAGKPQLQASRTEACRACSSEAKKGFYLKIKTFFYFRKKEKRNFYFLKKSQLVS
jgi:hypothetical protein